MKVNATDVFLNVQNVSHFPCVWLYTHRMERLQREALSKWVSDRETKLSLGWSMWRTHGEIAEEEEEEGEEEEVEEEEEERRERFSEGMH